MKKLLLSAAIIAAFVLPCAAQTDVPVTTSSDPLSLIVTAVVTVIIGAIGRAFEKRKLRREGKLVDKM